MPVLPGATARHVPFDFAYTKGGEGGSENSLSSAHTDLPSKPPAKARCLPPRGGSETEHSEQAAFPQQL